MKTIKGCCGCSFILLLVILVAIAVLIALLLAPGKAHAQTNGDRAICAGFGSPASAIPITAAIALSLPNASARGTFFTQQITVTRRGAECIAVAATPDGGGAFWVDDAMAVKIVHANGTTAQWSRDFRNADHTQVIAIPPQDLSSLFAIGDNRVTVTLEDLSPNVYGSSALWLVVFAPSAPIPSISSSPVPTLVTQTTVPAVTPTPLPTATPLAGIPSASAAQSLPTTAKPDDSLPIVPVIAGGALFLVIIGFVVARARPSTTPTNAVLYAGTLNVLDDTNFESTNIELADWPNGVDIWTVPLRLETPSRNGQPPIRATTCGDGLRLQVENSSDPMLLRHGDGATIGKLKLTLENNFGGEE